MVDWIARVMGRWLDRRLHLAKVTRRVLNHVFPDHWSFMLGEIALYSFVILVITGVFLALFFDASSAKVTYYGSYHALEGARMSAALQSVLKMSFDVPAGLLVRQMHHWAALIFLAAILTHLTRIFLTAAYRRPREINWMIGLTLLILALTNGYLGYSLAGDLLSGGGLRIAYSLMLSVPLIGKWLAFKFLGGNIPADLTTPHMYGMHIFVVPFLIAILIGLHLAIIWKQMHTNYPGPGRTDRTIVGSRLWPSYTAKSLGLFFLLFASIAALAGFVQIDPVWVYGPYDPIAAIPGAQPDWYLGWVEGAMRLFPRVNVHFAGSLVPEAFFPGVLLPALLFGFLYLYPFLESLSSGTDHNHHVLLLPSEQPFRTALGFALFIFLLVLLFAGSDDVIAVATGTAVSTIRVWLRILVFAAPAALFTIVYGLCVRAQRRRVPPQP